MAHRAVPAANSRSTITAHAAPTRFARPCPPLPALARFRIIDKDYAEGRRAFMEKRKPQFQGR